MVVLLNMQNIMTGRSFSQELWADVVQAIDNSSFSSHSADVHSAEMLFMGKERCYYNSLVMKGEFCGFIASLLNTKPNKGIWKMSGRDN